LLYNFIELQVGEHFEDVAYLILDARYWQNKILFELNVSVINISNYKGRVLKIFSLLIEKK
jgi:hypothetical protein